jgi:glycosyltransferase involved in cell wall biosynthesis
LATQISRREIQDKVTFISNVSNRTLNEIRSQNAIFVLPSVAEGLSVALLEAMQAGQIIVASKIESHESILEHERNSLLFEVDDPADLAKEILFCVKERALAAKRSLSAKQLCETEFSNVAVARRLESIYFDLLTDTRARPAPKRRHDKRWTQGMIL